MTGRVTPKRPPHERGQDDRLPTLRERQPWVWIVAVLAVASLLLGVVGTALAVWLG
ncbi:MAG: hypothetical protein S0880_09625 [Actinomycetota bacterium]|nr:hypothetical protein [Actinomycetota bacterium]